MSKSENALISVVKGDITKSRVESAKKMANTQVRPFKFTKWIPAFAGMTVISYYFPRRRGRARKVRLNLRASVIL